MNEMVKEAVPPRKDEETPKRDPRHGERFIEEKPAN